MRAVRGNELWDWMKHRKIGIVREWLEFIERRHV